jgi:hypothetical protein
MTKIRKCDTLTIADIQASIKQKAAAFDTLAELIKTFPAQDMLTCKLAYMDDPNKDLKANCQYRIPFHMKDTQFMSYQGPGIGFKLIDMIPAAIDPESHYSINFEITCKKSGSYTVKLRNVCCYIYKRIRRKHGNTEIKDYINPSIYEDVGQDSVYGIIKRAMNGNARKSSAVSHATNDVEWLKGALTDLIPAVIEDDLYKAEQAMYNMATDKALGVLK